MPWADQADTLVHAWYGGQETGHGLVDVLFGDVNPSGRVSMTFPKSVKHNPAYLTFGKSDFEIMYGEGVYIGHRYYEAVERDPLFYFGYGLSYSSFHYTDLNVPSSFEPIPEHSMAISVKVENKSALDGAEVVQVYVHDPESSVQRPFRELKAFSKVLISAGETKTVELNLDKYAVSYWSEEDSRWTAEKGRYVVIVARSSDPGDEICRKSFEIPRTFSWSGL